MAIERLPSDSLIKKLVDEFLPPKPGSQAADRTLSLQNTNGPILPSGVRRLVVNGRKMIAIDLGAKGLRGCMEAANPRLGAPDKRRFGNKIL